MARVTRVMHVLAPAPMGGLERVVQMLGVAQARAGYEVAVRGIVSPSTVPHPFFDAFRDTGVDATPVLVRDRAWARELGALSEAFREWRPEVVNTHGYRADVLGGLAARRAGVPVIATAHGFTGGGLKNRLYERLQVSSYRRRSPVIAVSEPLRDELRRRGVPSARIRVIRNGWTADGDLLGREDARRRLGLSAGATVAGWVGRIGPEKGADVAVSALPHLPRVRLSLVGEGGMADAVRRQADELGVGERIDWHGWTARADLLLRAFDVLILSSRTEGTPIILLEAMAAGVPIVATSVGGVPDVVRDGRDALLVPSEDPVALARAVQSCLEDQTAASARAAAARERLHAEFGLDAWVARYDEAYRMVTRKERT